MSEKERPFKKDKDAWEPVTVGMLKKMLKTAPDDFEVRYDSFVCNISKGDFTIDRERKAVCLNG